MSRISALKGFDGKTASGILARAALALSSRGLNPASLPVLDGEEEIRRAILDVARTSVASDTESDGDDALVDWLDAQVDELAEPVDEAAALSRLSLDALLPSDAYDLKFGKAKIEAIQQLDMERSILTIRSPDYQEDFIPSDGRSGPRTVSLFAKWFRSYTFEDRFLLLVISTRSSKDLIIVQTWRLYPSDLYFKSVSSLIGVMEKFAHTYGEVFSLGNFSGKFLYHHRYRAESGMLEFGFPGAQVAPFIMSMAYGPADEEGFSEVSFGMCINLQRYQADVSRHINRESERAKDQAARLNVDGYSSVGGALRETLGDWTRAL